jgi:hypothetical protein
MHCFEVTERVTPGLTILRDRADPYIFCPESCRGIGLHQLLADFIRDELPPGAVRIHRTTLDVSGGVIWLKKPSQRGEQQALVHLTQPAAPGGTIRLTASDFEWKDSGRAYEPFPPHGVQPLCEEAHLEELGRGVEELDVFLVLSPGASFRIFRSGELEGLSSELFVRWTRGELTVSSPSRPANKARLLRFDTQTGAPLETPQWVEYRP